jgi:LmbE family N-acetylglucosaminyl deacetylase
MGTIVSFHAHPDDEAIATGGTLAKASAEGHRVVLVVATKGDHGEVAVGFLRDGELLAERRVQETLAAAEILGVHRVEFLGYVDSGMAGEASNHATGSFWSADVDEAAERLAKILDDERADALTIYDDNGSYGHPDHIQVARVGRRAAELAGTANVLQATMNRDHLVRLIEYARDQGLDLPDMPDPDDLGDFGVPEREITTAIDIAAFLPVKRAAMAAHASQIAEGSMFLAMPDFAYEAVWGTEWFIRMGAAPREPGDWETDVFASAPRAGV